MYLLDTHTLLWYLRDSQELSKLARQTIDNADYVAVSIASLWEIGIKINIGKLKIEQSVQELAQFCLRNGMEIIGIKPVYCDILLQLPFIHNDPFDRIIMATAKVEGYTILTRDSIIPKYDVETIW